ncbi:5'-3' exonuclease [Aciduricibacillus chroicocephali]|uniref:5'-3' exonuclease n=1 Tax=Aciduricibacillus chroicocephali TaxID=3054939 RepID=A0ABY9KYU9_9BACI|nr:5'-3' exonuclease [Bacillaceae bacterium 44XB]
MLVDGMALLFRGFFATSFRGNFMLNNSGTPTNGVYQFTRYLLDAAEYFQPSHLICCWDMGSKTFRTELFTDYKANRGAPPEELIPQFEMAKEVAEILEIPNVGIDNFEADDCIGTLAQLYAVDNTVTILTGDQDILQLVQPGIEVAIMRKGMGNYEVFTADNFQEKRGLQPSQIIDLKGLMGDTSDNYPGVKGIGEKTALKLLQEHKTIDLILEQLDQLPKGVRTKIENDLDMLHVSRELAAIKCDVEIECPLERAEWKYDREIVRTTLLEKDLERIAKLV